MSHPRDHLPREATTPGRRLVGILMLALAAVLVGCVSTPESFTTDLSDNTGALAAAAAVVPQIDSATQQVEALNAIADGYLSQGNTADAATVAGESVRLLNNVQVSEETILAAMETATLLLLLDDIDTARRLISDATTYVESLRDEPAQAALLSPIIIAAIEGGEDTRDLLPAAVDPVYVLGDTEIRARAFLAIADVYSANGLAGSVNALVQQSIPAVRSIPSPSRRAELFGELALRARRVEEDHLAERLAEDAREELELALGEDAVDESAAVAVARAVTRERDAGEAVALLARVPDGRIRALAYVAIAAEARNEVLASLALDAATEVATGLEDPDQAITVLTEVALTQVATGRELEAVATAGDAAQMLTQSRNETTLVAALSRLASVYAPVGRSDEIRRYVEQISDPYGRAVVLIATADALLLEGQAGVADDFLVEALEQADGAVFFADNLRERIAAGFAMTGNYPLAISAIERMESPSSAAIAAAHLVSVAVRNGGLPPAQTDKLQAALQR